MRPRWVIMFGATKGEVRIASWGHVFRTFLMGLVEGDRNE